MQYIIAVKHRTFCANFERDSILYCIGYQITSGTLGRYSKGNKEAVGVRGYSPSYNIIYIYIIYILTLREIFIQICVCVCVCVCICISVYTVPSVACRNSLGWFSRPPGTGACWSRTPHGLLAVIIISFTRNLRRDDAMNFSCLHILCRPLRRYFW
jgi:hypothetical protein